MLQKTILIIFFITIYSFGQTNQPSKNGELYKNAPEWAKLMYSENPNVNSIDRLYKAYYAKNTFKKSYHTQYYKRWRKAIDNFIDDAGFYSVEKKYKLREVLRNRLAYKNVEKSLTSGNWSVIGPFQNFREGGLKVSGAQGNIYSIGQCTASPNILYCGTENGEIYRTNNGGDNWFNVSLNLITALAPQVTLANAGVAAIAVHPSNPDIVYAGAGSEIFKTSDGGLTWNVVFDSAIPLYGYIENPAEILIHNTNPNIVLVASKAGIHRTSDAGLNWTQVADFECFDVKARTDNANIMYAVRRNNTSNLHQFLRSTNAGLTWSVVGSGWYTSSNPSRTVEGARLAVSNANPNRIYAFLIGDSKPGDNGFIGVYKSNDGGTSWVNTMGYDGAPYDENTHPNLISSIPTTTSFSFNQGFYNCAIMASNTNEDELLVGGIGMWRSTDGGASFSCIYNYTCGNYQPMHVDMQDFRAFDTEYWASTDGGIYKSLDLFGSQPEFKMNGMHGVDFWGFDSGWNHDLLVGGTFHNGVDVYYEGFPSGDFLDLGGGEPASGYVNPGNALKIYSTNIGSKIIPESITGATVNAYISMLPNESPWFAKSSEMEFHPSCYNIIYLGKDNQLFKSEDGGVSFTAVYTAPSTTEQVLGIEISRHNTDTMYIVVRPTDGNASLVKTTDNWVTHTTLSLPGTGGNLALISIDPENDQIVWVGYARGNDANKVYKTTDGGLSWTNETSSELNGQNIQSIVAIGGTNGGVYVGTSASVYYKNNTLSSWGIDNLNLPATIGTKALKPFYRDGKIRLASYGKGIWESPFSEAPTRPVAKIMVDKLTTNCIEDIFYFDDYSMLNHTGATWEWTFENADISTANVRNPEVSFTTEGTHLVTLTVTNNAGLSDTDTLYIDVESLTVTEIEEGFETTFLPDGWSQEASSSFSWTYNDTVGGYGLSSHCIMVDNHSINDLGETCDIIAPLNMSALDPSEAILEFDVAYAQYSGAYADALEVSVSLDCGKTFTSVYYKTGADLATAPNTTAQFIPENDQWRTESIDLSPYLGNGNVQIKFRNINDYGQTLYLDNINVGGAALSVPDNTMNTLLLYPNPVTTGGYITIKSPIDEQLSFSLFSIGGKQIKQITLPSNTSAFIKDWYLSSGLYVYEISSKNRIQKGKLIVSPASR